MKRMTEAWHEIYENSTMSAQTLRENATRFRKDNSLLHLIKVRDGKNVENVEENEKNEEKIMENINEEEDEETRIMSLRFEEILHTLEASTKETTEGKERLMKLKK